MFLIHDSWSLSSPYAPGATEEAPADGADDEAGAASPPPHAARAVIDSAPRPAADRKPRRESEAEEVKADKVDPPGERPI